MEYVNYFAYGANLSPDIFTGKRGMRPRGVRRASLENFRLVFNEPGTPIFEPAFANIEPASGEHVEGVIYDISSEQLAALLSHEGGGRSYELIAVNVCCDDSPSVDAVTLRSKKIALSLRPSARYMDLIIAGAAYHDLSDEWILYLKQIRVVRIPFAETLKQLQEHIFRLIKSLGFRDPYQRWRDAQTSKAVQVGVQ